MRSISFRAIAVCIATVMLIVTTGSTVYGEVKNTDDFTDEKIHVTDEFRVNDVSLDDDSELADVMKYARNNKNEYLIVKKESASTSAFKNSVKKMLKKLQMFHLIYIEFLLC